ncbi:MAG: 4Fe-4S dicluster domain-containing protein [Oscillospiraceae bacterium]|jgi:Fe-S-cluster-containing dehydrogenase component|nr:4Fe-4S dicluster domain-containing protein [Oscillospiraceae bacterium]
MAKAFVIDVAKCSGCYNCQLACKDEHVGNDWTPYALPQPDIGQFWCRVEEHVQGTIPKVRIHYIARLCNHCRRPACASACSEKAIYTRDDGFVIIDPEKCTGCGECASACPYGAIFMNAALKKAQKCTGCAHLLDNGAKLPRCVEACPTDAIMFGEEDELTDQIEGASVIMPETACFPRVYYRNVPGKFIGGTLYDPEENEVVIGARCLLHSGGKNWEAVSDSYGDFWFNDLPVGLFTLVIQAPGYRYKTFENIKTSNAVNLGDIPLEREDKG